jgi:hypothetical protein
VFLAKDSEVSYKELEGFREIEAITCGGDVSFGCTPLEKIRAHF